ncbi:MAG: HEAT repeat domain-containing protein [Myxococcota bacterium]|nr:HEAT repeat domain-containing protein [Myxococcota bacterium]
MKKYLLALAVMAAAPPALAQNAEVAAHIKLIENQPNDMDRAVWKDKRREAARKLVQSKDKKAVPVLIKLAEGETFDIIGEIAIEGLGNMGDQSAVPALQKIANDVARDKAQRDLATKSLKKLGAGTTGTPPKETTPPPKETTPPPKETTGLETNTGGTETAPPPEETTTTTTTAAAGSTLIGERPATGTPDLPVLADDTIAAYERLTFVGGVASFRYDTLQKRMSFDADAGGLFQKRVERERMAWGVDIGADFVAGFVNPEGREQLRGGQLVVQGVGEVRFYSGKIYGVGKAAVGMQGFYIKNVDDDDANADVSDKRMLVDVQVALGGGFGRLVDIGGAIRVRRLSRTLDAARALGKPIDAATAKKLQLTWWALRGERSAFSTLTATVAILREAGILLGEPDAGLTYEIINVLRDSWLYVRPQGFDVQVTVSEGYLRRPGDDPNPYRQKGRVEQVLAYAGYGSQLQDDKLEISGMGYGRYRLFAPDDQPSPWAVGATAKMRRFTYGEHGDSYGMFDLGGGVQLAQDDIDFDGDGTRDSKTGLGVHGELGFTWWMNQASGIRLGADVRMESKELFIGANLSATYGFLDATFAGL